MLYVHPAAGADTASRTMLVDALEKLAAARGAGRLTADVSDAAVDFFAKRGFVRADAQHACRSATNGSPTPRWKRNCSRRRRAMSKPDTPFPKHWLYYIILKYGVIAAAC